MTNHRFDQIDSVGLDAVTGGQLTCTLGSQRRTCEEGAARRAREQYPDTRWFWQRWTGTGTDTNAALRADAERKDIRETCGLPQNL